jgi:hypothetical protein
MKEVVDEAYRTGDTVGGVFEVVARGVPVGLGSHVTWDSRLDGRLAQAIVSMQAVKGVEIGFAAEGAASFGSKVQDTIHYDREGRRFTRGANRAGGLEGGITNGQDVLVRGMLKPISTLRRPLESVDLVTREAGAGGLRASDVCVVPAAGVIGEAMVAMVLAQAFLEKFGGDSLANAPQFRRISGTGENFLRDMVYPIVKLGDPVLEREAEEVTEFDTPELHKFLEDMFESMYAAKGRGPGRAADRLRRKIAVIDVSNGERPEDKLVLINPRDREGRRQAGRRRGLPEHPRIPRAGAARRASPYARRTPRARSSKDRRRSAGARLPARDRSPQRRCTSPTSARSSAT